MDYTTLNTLLTNNPDALDLSALDVSDHIIAATLNGAPPAALAATTPITQASRGDLLKALIPAVDQLASGKDISGAALASGTSARWEHRFAALRSGADTVTIDADMVGLLNQMVADKLTTAALVTAITTRAMSYAEVKFGAGTVVDWTDVMQARRLAGHRPDQASA